MFTSRLSWLRDLLKEGNRDIDGDCNYPVEINSKLCMEQFRRNPIANRIVCLYPDECWQNDPEVYEQEDPALTPFETAWKLLDERFNLMHYMHRADVLSGIGRYGVLLLGINDGAGSLDQPLKEVPETGVKLDFSRKSPKPATPREEPIPSSRAKQRLEGETPPEESNTPPKSEDGEDGDDSSDDAVLTTEQLKGIEKLIYINVFDETLVNIDSYVTDVKNPRYGLPEMYSITFSEVSTTAMTTSDKQIKVHWSRIVHLADNRLSSEVFGMPRLEKNFNNVLDVKKVLASDAEGFYKGAFPGLSIESHPGDEPAELDEEKTKEQVDRYQNSFQRYFYLLGMTAKTLEVELVDPTPHFNIQIQAIAIGEGCPLRLFLGSEEAKLASSQDKRTWNRRLIRRQGKYITPMIIRPFVDRLIAVGVLPMPESYSVYWSDLDATSEEEQATIARVMTESLVKYIQGGVDTLIPPEEFLTMVMRFDREEVMLMLEAAEKRVKELADDADVPGRDPMKVSEAEQVQFEQEQSQKMTDAAAMKAAQKAK